MGSCLRLCFAGEFRPHTQRDGKLLEIMFCWRVSTSHSEGWEVARDYALLESWALVERVLKTAPQCRRFLPPNHRYRDLCRMRLVTHALREPTLAFATISMQHDHA